MIKEFFDEGESVLKEICSNYNTIFGIQYKVERPSWYRPGKGKQLDEDKTYSISEKDLDINGGSVNEWYPGLNLYDERSDFRLRLEYSYCNSGEYSGNTYKPESNVIKYGVFHKDVSWEDIQAKNQVKINLLHNNSNCKKLEDLFFMFLQNSVIWHSKNQPVFDGMAKKLKKSSAKGDASYWYFVSEGFPELVQTIKSDDSSAVEKQALLVAEKMFQDALLIKWF